MSVDTGRAKIAVKTGVSLRSLGEGGRHTKLRCRPMRRHGEAGEHRLLARVDPVVPGTATRRKAGAGNRRWSRRDGEVGEDRQMAMVVPAAPGTITRR